MSEIRSAQTKVDDFQRSHTTEKNSESEMLLFKAVQETGRRNELTDIQKSVTHTQKRFFVQHSLHCHWFSGVTPVTERQPLCYHPTSKSASFSSSFHYLTFFLACYGSQDHSLTVTESHSCPDSKCSELWDLGWFPSFWYNMVEQDLNCPLRGPRFKVQGIFYYPHGAFTWAPNSDPPPTLCYNKI